MSWRETKAKWDADPAFRQAYEDEYPYASMASAVARLRADSNLTQEGLAQLVGTTQSVIARLEGGRHAVNVDLLRRIAHALGREWRPVFETAGVRDDEQPAANIELAPATRTVIDATYSRIKKTIVFKYSDFYASPSAALIYDVNAHVEMFIDMSEGPSIPLTASVSRGDAIFLGNYPSIGAKGSSSAMARN